MESISSSQKTINQLRENFLSIERYVLLMIFLENSCCFLYVQLLGFNSVLKHSTLRTNVFTCFCLRLCQECQNLIENHDQIKLLSNVRNNLNTTLKVNAMSDLCFHQLFLYHDMFLAYTHTNIQKFLSLYIYAHVIVQLQLAVY